ncbi:MAG: glycosyltransferase, partial [Verrucomicrobia bacterium]|nr:glycosyltransferase [Verrucomicrobiota bacterium]
RAEPGKQLAFARAQGEYLCFLDADNEIASTDWLQRAVDALDAHPDALGFESYYIKAPGDAPLNRFITGLLQVSSDPVVRTISRRAHLLSEDAHGVQVFALPADGAYPTGANGFIFKREWIQSLGEDSYHEASFFPELIRGGRRELIKIRDLGIHHYYCAKWGDYISKRRYTMVNYLLRKEEHPVTWEGKGPNGRMAGALLFHGSLMGPAIAGLWNAIRQRDAEWLLYPAVSLCSVIGNALGALDYYTSGSREERTAKSVELHQKASDKRAP